MGYIRNTSRREELDARRWEVRVVEGRFGEGLVRTRHAVEAVSFVTGDVCTVGPTSTCCQKCSVGQQGRELSSQPEENHRGKRPRAYQTNTTLEGEVDNRRHGFTSESFSHKRWLAMLSIKLRVRSSNRTRNEGNAVDGNWTFITVSSSAGFFTRFIGELQRQSCLISSIGQLEMISVDPIQLLGQWTDLSCIPKFLANRSSRTISTVLLTGHCFLPTFRSLGHENSNQTSRFAYMFLAYFRIHWKYAYCPCDWDVVIAIESTLNCSYDMLKACVNLRNLYFHEYGLVYGKMTWIIRKFYECPWY